VIEVATFTKKIKIKIQKVENEEDSLMTVFRIKDVEALKEIARKVHKIIEKNKTVFNIVKSILSSREMNDNEKALALIAYGYQMGFDDGRYSIIEEMTEFFEELGLIKFGE